MTRAPSQRPEQEQPQCRCRTARRPAQGSRNNRNAVQRRPPRQEREHPAAAAGTLPARDEDPGLVLISRRPPQQKFTNFESI